jgi:hypothetical protein
MNKILMIFLFALLAGCSDVASSEESISTISELDQTISYSIMDNFGYRHEIEDDAVNLIEFDEETGNMKIIVSTYAFEDETYEDFKADTLESCANVLQDIKRQLEVQEVDLAIETPIENLEGNPDYNGTIFKMVFERRNLNNTDFHKLDPLELSNKANFYFQAPVTE